MENQETSEEVKNTPKRGPKPKAPEEKYYRVMFSQKASPSDPDDVELSVNGETLVIKRGVEVIIPARFKECADNATFQQFRQLPGKPRKLIGHIKVFPYQLMGESTKPEFDKMKTDGDRQTRKFIKQFGFDGTPEGD
jgi:hypothetical protein